MNKLKIVKYIKIVAFSILISIHSFKFIRLTAILSSERLKS